MAVTWEWSDKIGTVTVKDTIDGKQFTNNLYRGNCLMIEVNEFTDDRGKERYQMMSFWCDKDHAKRMLGLTKRGIAGDTSNNMDDGIYRYKEFRLNKNRRESIEIAKLLMSAVWKHGITVTLYNPEEENVKGE